MSSKSSHVSGATGTYHSDSVWPKVCAGLISRRVVKTGAAAMDCKHMALPFYPFSINLEIVRKIYCQVTRLIEK